MAERRRRVWVLVPLLAVVGGAVGWVMWPSSDPSSAEDNPTTLNTAEVVRTDLEEVTSYTGTLGRIDSDPITTRHPGTVTATAEPGTVVEEGDVLFEIDGEPVTLLYGDIPMWRELSTSADDGPDIEQLEQALVDLGYDPDETVTVDEDFTWRTRQMVQRWQEDLGVDDDGIVEVGDVVYLPSGVRISDRLVPVGTVVTEGMEILAVTGNDTAVTVGLPTSDQDLVDVGDPVMVELPDRTQVDATVVDVAAVATIGEDGEAVFEVTIALDEPSQAGGLDEAPVEVEIVTDAVHDVLAVPVTALLALAEGGYAVEVVDANGGVTLVGVEPGFYADGLVEVTGDGLEARTEVVVP